MNDPTLMVPIRLGRPNSSLVSVAYEVAEKMHASVIGLARARPLPTAVTGGGAYAGDIVREDIDDIEREAAAAEVEFRVNMKPCPVEWNMALTPHPLSGQIASAAAAADFLMVGLARDGNDFSNSSRRFDIGALIMQAGRPVFVVPPGIEHFGFGCALVAWQDCREARRALADAVPVLRLMDRVVLAEVSDSGRADARLDPVTAWLGRRGIASTSRFASRAGSDGDRLLQLAEEEGAELIVAGAYGYTRAREWMSGGVTRALLHRTKCCMLLSH